VIGQRRDRKLDESGGIAVDESVFTKGVLPKYRVAAAQHPCDQAHACTDTTIHRALVYLARSAVRDPLMKPLSRFNRLPWCIVIHIHAQINHCSSPNVFGLSFSIGLRILMTYQ
jgi:hypothetical protein